MTTIHFATDFSKLWPLIDRPAALIIDRNVLPHWSGDLFTIPIDASEEKKSRATKEMIEDALFQKGFGKDTLLLAMGGGVTTDLAGFVAATFCRGIPHINIPTTLLGMVDASIGGKTGVNHPLGKNLIGAFHPPLAVYANLSLLKSLSEKQWRMGWVEMVKHGLIASLRHFEGLERDTPLKNLIEESMSIKLKIVEQDPNEKGMRRLLNFGHTFGHAIEWASHYTLSHGEAVLMGLLAESHLSHRLGYLSLESLRRIEKLLLPYRVNLPPENMILSALSKDKKGLLQKPRFVLLKEIGEPLSFEGEYCQKVEPDFAMESLNAYRRH